MKDRGVLRGDLRTNDNVEDLAGQFDGCFDGVGEVLLGLDWKSGKYAAEWYMKYMQQGDLV